MAATKPHEKPKQSDPNEESQYQPTYEHGPKESVVKLQMHVIHDDDGEFDR
ncbi:uncharacterized protein METZ01_LOCUS17156 [marine metagenome]|uniref:Uncharacterized protein n=1 Tax=marine metagenome TaxID=408172 RepID=A0A381PBE1_9ZZZZ